ncbi:MULTISPECIES: tetratricopeptide repeat protein [unclassified Prochlorococcus]|uniref:tetratricopeptide repeat protein n=1 Tax=unclassified Prochlorococcus TaxID=2627481 RepID=UPI000533B499|nr:MULTISPECIES: tetratricopeptide repeat protein [unclassified Prochlorococcus]KGG14491.1 hypothetical protein EV06_1548 [Prochlorococcus sp. MIT 0602]KGG16084.1 hypothetical protein EV07_2052 [Prochlorococcus sp. MIT 0603]
MSIRNKKQTLCYLICGILSVNILSTIKPANAFVPYVYLPNEKTLKYTSIEIGLTASRYIQYGKIKEALSLAKLALSLNPNEVELWIILSKAQLGNNKLSEAYMSIEKAKEINEKSPAIWYTKASIEMQMGKTEKAIKSIEKTISLDRFNSNAYFLLGNARLIQLNYTKALKAFKKAASINPKFWQAINNEGLIYYELGFKNKAISTWRKVIKIESDPEPKLALAIALYALDKNNEEAIELAKKALQESPNYLFQEHQESQLWGKKLQEGSKKLFNSQKLKSVISTASANSNLKNKKEQ